MTISRRAAFLLLAALTAAIPPVADRTEAVHIIPRFTFNDGASLGNMRVGYVNWGRLNKRRDNAVLLLYGTSGTRSWPANHVGAGRAFDPDRHFIISAGPIGGRASSIPADGLGPDHHATPCTTWCAPSTT